MAKTDLAGGAGAEGGEARPPRGRSRAGYILDCR